jgi:hypothetical protein
MSEIVLLSLNDSRWGNLQHAYGNATDTPTALLKLKNLSSNVALDGVWEKLWSSLCHQGKVFSASFAAVPHIVANLEQQRESISFNHFALPVAIEVAREKSNVAVPTDTSDAYFGSLQLLSGFAFEFVSVKSSPELRRSALSAVAINFGDHAVAELLLEVDQESIPQLLDQYLS